MSIERLICSKEDPPKNLKWEKTPPQKAGWFWFKTNITIRLLRIKISNGTPFVMGSDDPRDGTCCQASDLVGDWSKAI